MKNILLAFATFLVMDPVWSLELEQRWLETTAPDGWDYTNWQPSNPYQLSFSNHDAEVLFYPSSGYPYRAFSTHDSGIQPERLMELSPEGSPRGVTVTASRQGSVYFSLYAIAQGGGIYHFEVLRIDPTGITPNRVYQHPSILNGYNGSGGYYQAAIQVTSDDRYVIAIVKDVWDNSLKSVKLDATSLSPVSQIEVSNPGLPRRLQVSETGDVVLVYAQTRLKVFSLADGLQIGSSISAGSGRFLDARLSRDGSFIAAGKSEGGGLKIYRRDPGGYVLDREVSFPNCDIQGVGLARHAPVVGAGCADAGLNFRRMDIKAVNYLTGQVLRTDAFQDSSTTLQNGVGRVAVSDDGSKMFIGLWGGGNSPEVLGYDLTSPGVARVSAELRGSVRDVRISSDGKRVLVASKGGHANLFENGGDLTLFEVEDSELDVQGVPFQSQSVVVEVSGTPGHQAFLLVSNRALSRPKNTPIGKLYLARQGMQRISLGVIPSSGSVSHSYSVPSMVGAQRVFQGYTRSGTQGRLTQNYRALTVFP